MDYTRNRKMKIAKIIKKPWHLGVFHFQSHDFPVFFCVFSNKHYRNCARKPIPSLPGFSRGMNGACVAKHIAV